MQAAAAVVCRPYLHGQRLQFHHAHQQRIIKPQGPVNVHLHAVLVGNHRHMVPGAFGQPVGHPVRRRVELLEMHSLLGLGLVEAQIEINAVQAPALLLLGGVPGKGAESQPSLFPPGIGEQPLIVPGVLLRPVRGPQPFDPGGKAEPVGLQLRVAQLKIFRLAVQQQRLAVAPIHPGHRGRPLLLAVLVKAHLVGDLPRLGDDGKPSI